MNRAEPLSLAEKIMAQHSEPHAPGGTYDLCTDLPEVGLCDVQAEIAWSLQGGRVAVDGIAVWHPLDGPQELDPVHGTSLAKALYARLASIALSKSEDILEAYNDSL